MIERKLIEVSLLENLKPGDLFIPILENERVSNYAQKAYVNLPYTHETFMLIGPAERVTWKKGPMTFLLRDNHLPLVAINVSRYLACSFEKKDNVIALDINFLINDNVKKQYLQNVMRSLGMNIPKKIIFCQEGNAFDVSNNDDLDADKDQIYIEDKRGNLVGYIEATTFEGFKSFTTKSGKDWFWFNGYIDKSDDSLWLVVEGVGEEKRIPITGHPQSIAIGKGLYYGL